MKICSYFAVLVPTSTWDLQTRLILGHTYCPAAFLGHTFIILAQSGYFGQREYISKYVVNTLGCLTHDRLEFAHALTKALSNS